MSTEIIQFKTFNSATGEEVIRDATNEELAQIKEARAADAQAKAAIAQAATDKAALLAKLGITADEAKLLLS